MHPAESMIAQIERKNKVLLTNHLDLIFSEVWLPSHNRFHHDRVWSFVKEILLAYLYKGATFSHDFVEALMVAVYFHDTGLTRTLSVKHGHESAAMAKDFLAKYPKMINRYQNEMMDAIVRHDEKDYALVKAGGPVIPSIYSILTVADDLDAFGAVGLIRYLEIYCLRGIENNQLKSAILQNLESRFAFLSLMFGPLPALLAHHKARYHLACMLLKEMDEQDFSFLQQQVANKVDLLDSSTFKSPDSFILNKTFSLLAEELKKFY